MAIAVINIPNTVGFSSFQEWSGTSLTTFRNELSFTSIQSKIPAAFMENGLDTALNTLSIICSGNIIPGQMVPRKYDVGELIFFDFSAQLDTFGDFTAQVEGNGRFRLQVALDASDLRPLVGDTRSAFSETIDWDTKFVDTFNRPITDISDPYKWDFPYNAAAATEISNSIHTLDTSRRFVAQGSVVFSTASLTIWDGIGVNPFDKVRLYAGDKPVQEVRIGSTLATAVYRGETKVYG